MHWSTGIVLIVDSEDEVLAIHRTTLQSTDYVLLQAKIGDEALAVLQTGQSGVNTLCDCKINGNRARNIVEHSQTRETGMSAPSHPSANLQANRHWVEFMNNESALCFTFSTIAARKYGTGDQESAETSMANAETAYETVIQFLSDRKHSTHFTQETIQEFTAELERLRERLDRLRERFKK